MRARVVGGVVVVGTAAAHVGLADVHPGARGRAPLRHHCRLGAPVDQRDHIVAVERGSMARTSSRTWLATVVAESRVPRDEEVYIARIMNIPPDIRISDISTRATITSIRVKPR